MSVALTRPDARPASVPLARRLFRGVARRRIAAELDGLHVCGLELAQAALARGPVIFAATHVSWWDSLVLLALAEALGADGRALMDAANLEALPFFRWVGALPVDRSGPGRARRGLHDAAAFLAAPGRALWVFPQGRQRPAHLRPLGLERGIDLVARSSGATIVAVGLNYGFRDLDRVAAVACFEAPRPVGAADLEADLIRALGRIDQFLDRGGMGFETTIASTRARADQDLPTRMLAALARGAR